MFRSVLIVLLSAVVAGGGCGGGGSSGLSVEPATTVTEDQAVSIAMDAVRDNDSFAETASYTAKESGNGWAVTVVDEEAGELRIVVIDGEGNVSKYESP